MSISTCNQRPPDVRRFAYSDEMTTPRSTRLRWQRAADGAVVAGGRVVRGQESERSDFSVGEIAAGFTFPICDFHGGGEAEEVSS